MTNNLQLVKNGQTDDGIRKSFNNLAYRTFSLDFEDWYQNGYWGGSYIPYSFLDKGRVVANVSVNPMEFNIEGKIRRFIQLGTVMTEPEYRNRGLIRTLMGKIEEDYREKTEGFYLFANHSVLDFYPKFGFKRCREYEYYKTIENSSKITAEKVSLNGKEACTALQNAIKTSCIQSAVSHTNGYELIMFYLTKFMQDNLYYIPEEEAYVIAETQDNTLYLHNIYSPVPKALNSVIQAFGDSIHKVFLGFTPLCTDGFVEREIKGDDTLFIKGNILEQTEKKKLRFPSLSHA